MNANAEGCLLCARELCIECGRCDCCSEDSSSLQANGGKISNGKNAASGQNKLDIRSNEFSGGPSRNHKPDAAVLDVKSTGRKRAAVAFPLDPTLFCEWRGLANCGGGKFPIIGCINGHQQARHHGPDKNTLNNTVGNVHRICHNCHNIWHTRNDPNYDPDEKHNPRPATEQELLDREMKVRYCTSEEGFSQKLG